MYQTDKTISMITGTKQLIVYNYVHNICNNYKDKDRT